MATKKKASKKAASKADNLKKLRTGEQAQDAAPAVDKKAAAKEKAAKAKQDKVEKLAAAKKATADARAAEKIKRDKAKADKKAEAEAAKAPKTGALTIDQFKSFADGETIAALKEPSEAEKDKMAIEGDKQMRQFDSQFIKAAITIRKFMVWELWRRVVNPDTGNKDFKSLEKWAESAMKICRSERFKAIRVAESVVPHLSEQDLEDIGSKNVRLLIDVPKAKLADPEIIKGAKGTEKQARAAINKIAPEAHVDEKQEFVRIPADAKKPMDEAIEAFIELYALASHAEALEAMAAYCMAGPYESDEYPHLSGKSHREAFDQLTEERNKLSEPEPEPEPEEEDAEYEEGDEVPEVHASGERD